MRLWQLLGGASQVKGGFGGNCPNFSLRGWIGLKLQGQVTHISCCKPRGSTAQYHKLIGQQSPNGLIRYFSREWVGTF